jgi:hypothetical protein
MPGALVHVGAIGSCPHLGQMTVLSSNVRVFVSGAPVATVLDMFPIALCPFTLPTVPPTPHPCVRVQWTVPATRVFVNGMPVVLQLSTGLCLAVDFIPQGPATVITAQPRVTGL